MENFKLLQIVPSLISGGVERGTIDLSNYLSEKNIKNYIASSGGILLNQLNNKNSYHIKLPLDSKNFLKYFFIAKQVEDKIKDNGINMMYPVKSITGAITRLLKLFTSPLIITIYPMIIVQTPERKR